MEYLGLDRDNPPEEFQQLYRWDENEAAKLAAEAGYDPYEKKVKTITELSKEMGKKKFEEVLGKVVVKPQGKPVLVREDDKRPALNTAKNDFK